MNQVSPTSDRTSQNTGHMFHANCLMKWVETKQECPLCKELILP